MRDATLVHHGSIEGGVVAALAGLIDPRTHLNTDFVDHELGECVIAEQLDVGSPVLKDEQGQFVRASPRRSAWRSYGPVDLGARRVAWLNAFSANR